MSDIKTEQNKNPIEQNKKNLWDKIKGWALSVGMTLLVSTGAFAGAGSAFADNSKSVNTDSNTPKTTKAIPEKIDNTLAQNPQQDEGRDSAANSNLILQANAKTEVKSTEINQTAAKSNLKLAQLKTRHLQENQVDKKDAKQNPIDSKTDLKEQKTDQKLADLKAMKDQAIQTGQKSEKANPANLTKSQTQPPIQTAGELTIQNAGTAKDLQAEKLVTFNQVNAHFKKLNAEQQQTQNPKKAEQRDRIFGPANVNELRNPGATTSQVVGKTPLSSVKPILKETRLSNEGDLLPTFSRLEVKDLNLGVKPNGNYQLDFKSSTFNATTIPITEKRTIGQKTPVGITNISINQNLILESQKNGETVNQTILPGTKIEANVLDGTTTRTTTNPSLGLVSAQTVAEIKKPGFFFSPESTFSLNIKGAAIVPIENTVIVNDNTQTNYGLVLSSGEQNRKVVISGDQAAVVNNTRNFVVIPDQEKGQGAILATNIAGQLIPQLDVNLINNGKGDPARLNPDLIPFSTRVYRGDNPALSIANSSISYSRQLEIGKPFPSVITSGFNIGFADKYAQTVSRRSIFTNLSPERSIFNRSFDPLNADLNISANINGVTFNNNNTNVYPEIKIDLTTQEGIKNTFTTSNKTIYRIPEFAGYIQERSRTQFTEVIAGFTVDTINKFEINPFLKAVFAQYDQNGAYYFTLAGQVYMIPNDSQRSKIDLTAGTANIKLVGDVSVQPFFRAVYNFGGVKPSDKTNLAIFGFIANLGGGLSFDLGQLINIFPDSTTGTTGGIGFNSGDFRVKVNAYNLNTGSGTSAEVRYNATDKFSVTFRLSSDSQPGVTTPSTRFGFFLDGKF